MLGFILCRGVRVIDKLTFVEGPLLGAHVTSLKASRVYIKCLGCACFLLKEGNI